MMLVLVAKSAVIAGATLLLLRLLHQRSASDRSAVAHLGLGAIALLPLGSLLVPSLEIVTPRLSMSADTDSASPATGDWADWLLIAYAVPALLLVGLTFLHMLRLASLRARTRAVTDEYWLRALAAAQRRFGVKKRITLLASDEIPSPVSWGLTTPVILLDAASLGASGHADDIIVHELTHIIRRDWARLVLSRITVALFWPNPLVWWLAREAHQLREEAADDAVLEDDAEDTAYASLLVSTARRERGGLLPAALGVAPARGSLARRVQRVLDSRLDRSVGGTRWAAAMAVSAAALTAPVMTLQFTDPGPASPVSAPLASGDGAEPIVFRLRVPPAEPIPVPRSTQEGNK